MSHQRCHKEAIEEAPDDTAVIPGGCTKFIQAPDVYWNAPFKAQDRSFYENWMLNGKKSFNKSGIMQAPPMEVYLK